MLGHFNTVMSVDASFYHNEINPKLYVECVCLPTTASLKYRKNSLRNLAFIS